MTRPAEDAPALRPRRRTPSGILRDIPATRPLIVAAVAVVLVVAGAFALPGNGLDTALVRAANGVHTGVVATLTNAVYHIISPVPAILITAVLTGVILLVTRRLAEPVVFALVVAATWLPTAVVKAIAQRPRPSGLPHPFSPAQVDASYPSGHAAFAVVLLLALWFLLRDGRFAVLVAVLAPFAGIAVLGALVIDGVHYPSDVLASAIWALGVGPAVRLAAVRLVVPRLPALGRLRVSRAAAGPRRTPGSESDPRRTAASRRSTPAS